MGRLYCFVPSWYSHGEKWHSFPTRWYRKGIRMEFDDTVNQIKMFQQAGEEVRLLLPFYMPELRMFLHREGIAHVDIWSAFDRIQGIESQEPGLFSYRDFKWPDGLEWVYTPFLVVAYKNDELYAKVEFGEGGYVIFLEFYEKEELVRRVYVDDRGFLSCVSEFGQAGELFRTYYNQNQIWCMKENLLSGEVRLNPEQVQPFWEPENQNSNRWVYPDMDRLLQELLEDYLHTLPEDAALIVASDSRHNDRIIRIAKEIKNDGLLNARKVVLSFYQNRKEQQVIDDRMRDNILDADMVVTDTEYLAEALKTASPFEKIRCMDISPYDARVSLGKSQRIREQKILCFLGEANLGEQILWLEQLMRYVDSHKNMVLIAGIGNAFRDMMPQTVLETELDQIARNNRLERIHVKKSGEAYSENEVQKKIPDNVCVRNCRTETEIMELLHETRIIFDTGSTPDLYLQIAGISAGIPMILLKESQYAEHGKNGWILKEKEELSEALDYFLNGLENWNQALVYSVKKIGGYTNGAIVKKWKELLDA